MFFLFLSGETQKFFLTNYKEAKGRSLIQFWIDSVHDRSVLDLLIPSGLDPKSAAIEGSGELRRYSLVDLSSGAIDNKNLLNLSSDSLELFDDKEEIDEDDTCDNAFLRDGCMAGGTALKIAGRINSGNFDSLGEPDYRRIPPLEMITQALRRDPILRRLEKVSTMSIHLNFLRFYLEFSGNLVKVLRFMVICEPLG